MCTTCWRSRLRRTHLFGPGLLGLTLFLVGAPSPGQAAPEHLRLSYTGDTATTMTVSWHSTGDTPSEVQWGTQSGTYTQTASGNPFLANGALGWIHELTMTGLQPDTQYFYIVGNTSDGWSQESSFVTGPVESEQCAAFSFGFTGDNRPDPTLGGGDTWPQILAQLGAHDPNFVLNGGDLVIEGDDIGQWLDFLGWTEQEARRIPLMPCIGNHDNGPGEGDGANYNQIFALPRSLGTYGSGTEDYYYFTYGNAIFVALSTEGFKGGNTAFETQANWLDEVLTQNPKKWKFVYYHKPSYTHEAFFSISHEPNEENQNAALIPVIDAHHVDVVFTSHNHWYERFEPSACAIAGDPGSDEACSVGAGNYAQGTVYYVSGGAGAFTIPALLCSTETGRAVCDDDHHYILVHVTDHTATLETWGAHPQTNQIIDSITITKTDDSCTTTPDPDAGVPDAGMGPDGGGELDGGTGPDAASGNDAASGADAASGNDAGAPPGSPDSGCGCTTSHRSAPLPLGLALFFLLALRRRRR